MKNFFIVKKKSVIEIQWQSVYPINSYEQIENLLNFIFIQEKIDFCYLSVVISNRIFKQFISHSAWKSISNEMRYSIFKDIDQVVAVGVDNLLTAEKLVDSIEKAIVWQALKS